MHVPTLSSNGASTLMLAFLIVRLTVGVPEKGKYLRSGIYFQDPRIVTEKERAALDCPLLTKS